MALSTLKPGYRQDLSKREHWQLVSYKPTGVVLVHGTDRRFRCGPFDRMPLAVEAALQDRVPLLVFNAGTMIESAALKEQGIPISSIPYNFNDGKSKAAFNDAFLQAGHLPLVISLCYSSPLSLGKSATIAPEEWQVRVNESVADNRGEIHVFNVSAHYEERWTSIVSPVVIAECSLLGIGLPTYAGEGEAIPDRVESERRGFFGDAAVRKIADTIEAIWKIVNEKTEMQNAFYAERLAKIEEARANLQPGQELSSAEIDAIWNSVERPKYDGELRDVVRDFFNGSKT
ncbi:MAG: hypothetical protein Q7T16_04295 [Candidatus Burarchaeum sp.]|nr:hypothetical protein [Candidatus Burarchaeum sp.]MDO8339850.1 hypothetical protein [Candidatus Burarchaeum sp.]